MIFIVVKFPVRPEHVSGWLDAVAEFTASTRAEPGNLFFEWSRSADEPNTFVLVEAFRDGPAGGAHVQSEHFKAVVATMSRLVSARPAIINVDIPDQSGWGEMGEVSPSA